MVATRICTTIAIRINVNIMNEAADRLIFNAEIEDQTQLTVTNLILVLTESRVSNGISSFPLENPLALSLVSSSLRDYLAFFQN